MSANFKKGEQLSAQALNDAINGMVAPRGRFVPGQSGRAAQNRLPKTAAEPGVPVYLDKFSGGIPPGEEEGWYVWDEKKKSVAPVSISTGNPVYLVQKTDRYGKLAAACLTSARPNSVPWDPVESTSGTIVSCIGVTTSVNPVAAHKTGSCLNRFLSLHYSQVLPDLFNWGTPKRCLPCGFKEFDLVAPRSENSLLVRRIRSGGGLIEAPPVSGEDAPLRALHLAPRVSLWHYDTCCVTTPPATGYTEPLDSIPLGTWQNLARITIGNKVVYLRGWWQTPWRVGLEFSEKCIQVNLEKVAWTDFANNPVVGRWPHGLGPWKRVSFTPRVMHLCVPSMFPADCAYSIYNYAVYEAPGTLAPETVWENGEAVELTQRVLYVAQMRQKIHPTADADAGKWLLWDTTCLTAPLS